MNVEAKSVCLVVASLSLLTSLCLSSGAQAQPPSKPALAPTQQASPFANVPKDSWVYPAFSTLIDHHVLPSGYGGSVWPQSDRFTRYAAAVWLARGIDVIQKEETERNPHYRMSLRSLDDIALYKKLTAEFLVELEALGVDVPSVQRLFTKIEQESRAAEPPFPDVAPSHWASASVERLRVSGILVGYPDGTFLSKQN